ncbi:MAG: helix-turn-helix domain-containing protein, partial [Actinomycetota bacterium]|nr:helix-turn-helix domain-containing protein [Actinomycetota bacterium]
MGRGTRPWLGLLNVLGDHTRWHIYQQVRRAGRPLSRQEIAERVGVPPRLATFHLERLLEAGMLTAHYARPPGRSGPGAGRTAKYYAPT